MNRIQRQSLRIAAIYVAVAATWIILSDRLLLLALPPGAVDVLAELQSIKGLAFILVTGAMLYWLVLRSLQRVMQSQASYRDLIELSPIAIIVQSEGRLRFANAAAARLFRAAGPDELIGRSVLQLIDASFHNIVRHRISQMQQTGVPAPPLAETWLRLDGSTVEAEVGAIPLIWNGRPSVQVILHDISEAKAQAARLSFITSHDTLTGLPNWTLLRDRLAQEIIHDRRSGRGAALVVLDVAGLQFINDSRGYEAGDSVLRTIAAGLQNAIRPGDTAARISGDQFIVLLSDMHDRSGLATALEKIHAAAARTHALSGGDVFVGVHAGVALIPDDGEDPDALLKNAIAACHRAKRGGNAAAEFYTPAISEDSRKRVALQQALIDAIANQEFTLHYQPKVSTRSGRIAGCEALIRWNRPGHGLVPPAQFIPLAEETGHIMQIGDWVLREACRQMGAWQEQGLSMVPTAVNLSAPQLRQPGLGTLIGELFQQHHIGPGCLELELTESMLMGDAEEMIHLVNHLKTLGISFSLDDFGTGYSSFSYLRTFRVDCLKVDISFVRDITRSNNVASITRTIIAMGHGLGMQVVAEGVETAEQARLLQAWNCDLLQGYYFSQPVEASQFAALLPRQFDWAAGAEAPAQR